MKRSEIKKLAAYYGFDFLDISDRYPYSNRKGKTYGLYCRRDQHLEAAYTTTTQIKKYLEKLGEKNSKKS